MNVLLNRIHKYLIISTNLSAQLFFSILDCVLLNLLLAFTDFFFQPLPKQLDLRKNVIFQINCF